LSEYFVFGLVFAPAILLVLTIPLFRPNPNKPRYMVIVLKRVLFHISVALAFRIISFLVTTLPSPAEHCRLNFDQACLKQNPGDSIKCVIPNPDFKPPTTGEFFTNMDALNGM
jgi:sphingomyelin synthase-related protein 1